jgi:hypothetical protein
MSTAALSVRAGGLARVVRVMRLDVALAHKLAAWNERRLARDLYDVYCLHTLLGEAPDRETLLARLAVIESRLPALRGTKRMTAGEFAVQLAGEADALTPDKLEPLQSLLEASYRVGLEKKIRLSLHSLATLLHGW